ncbi:hypothetical protein PCANC_17099 [Puccinia coronata f. sp. avenae]|uniref:Uncharacterized protein n=1 Tax=Puccinia coronata f. sp. avenae TaxID=200324 RepID=A0A2N5U567_9BASI|nr:hypothetical protein PCANC_17099 [Puccinia coronata f. sp. avenae]
MSDSEDRSMRGANHDSEDENLGNNILSSSPAPAAALPPRRSPHISPRRSTSGQRDRRQSGAHRNCRSGSRNTGGPLGNRSAQPRGEDRPISTPSTKQPPPGRAEQVDDNLISELGHMFPLSGTYGELSEALAYVPSPQQYPVLLFGMLSIHQWLDGFCNSSGVLDGGRGGQESSAQTRARNFHFHPVFTTMVHTKSQQLLMSHELKVYSCDPPCDAPAGVESLLTLVLAYVNAQTPYFKDEYLPPGYMAHEPFAEASVNRLLHETLRHECGKFRDLLLTNVLNMAGNKASEVVPTMGQLMRILMDKLGAPAESADHTGARNSQATSHLRARMAFLRISTVKAYLAPAPGQQNQQWKRIDERLRWLNGQERLFRRA